MLSLPLFLFGFVLLAHAEGPALTVPPGNYSHQLRWTPLPDPAGVRHSSREYVGKVTVVIFSIPDMSQGPSQRRWSRLLADDPDSKVSDRVALVLIENMALAGTFRDEAMHDMVKKFAGKKRPFLLLDENGDTFKRFGIPRDRTEILVFDKDGTLRDVEQDLGDQRKTDERLKAITPELLK